MDISEALSKFNNICRKGWNGKNMYIFKVGTDQWQIDESFIHEPFLCLKTAQDTLIPWTASQQDIQADDWEEYK